MKAIKALLISLQKQNINIFLDGDRLKTTAKPGAITASIGKSIKENKEAIIELLKQEALDAATPEQTIEVVDRSSGLPLSFGQQRLWFIDSMQGHSAQYNMPTVFNVSGQLNFEVLKRVFNTIIERHEVLRTVYADDDSGYSKQHIRPLTDIDFNITQHDLSALKDDAQNTQLNTRIEASVNEPFDLANDLMLRTTYFKTSADTGILIFNMHHIASDGWSMEVLAQEFFTLYKAYITGQANPLPPLAIQYGDFAAWQHQHLGSEENKSEQLLSQLAYWEKQLDDVAPLHSLPLDFPRPSQKQFAGQIVSTSLPADVSKQLVNIAQQHQLTPFMLLHGALALLLSRYSNNHDIVVGMPVANRFQEALEPLIGFFVNTSVLRVNTDKPTLKAYFEHVRQTHLDAQSHQDVPFEQLVERLKVPRSTAYNPLFQIMLNTNTSFGINNDTEKEELSVPGAKLRGYESDFIQEKFDITIDINLSDQGVELVWTFDTSLFAQSSIARMNNSFATLLHLIADNPARDINDIPLLSDSDKQQLATWQQTKQNYPKDQNLADLFYQQACEHPQAIALTFNEQQLTYRQLDEQSNQLAHLLIERGVTPGEIVGFCLPRCINSIVAMLAIVKAGGAYLPLDPTYPVSRLEMMIQDSGTKLLLGDDSFPAELNEYIHNHCQLISLSDASLLADVATTKVAISQDLSVAEVAEQLLYVMYTSGSTGTPKGVMTNHLGVVRLVKNNAFMPLNAQTVMTQTSSISFDAATLEIWGPLLNGGQVVLYPEKHLDLSRLNQIILEHQVNTLWLTCGLFEQWSLQLPGDNALRYVVYGGDVSDPKAVARVYDAIPKIQCLHAYGPTENTTFTTTYTIPRDLDFESIKHLPLGHYIDGGSGKILQADGTQAAIGMIGELYTSGDGLALGYLNRPELTQEKFVVDENGIRYYRTGDLVRYLPNGLLNFAGRIDSQVKIRGFRIEPEEVANLLATHEQVQSATVQVCGQGNDRFLAGYYVFKNANHQAQVSDALNNQLMTWLKERLPPHMHPSVLIGLDEMPLNNNGKIDRRALPKPDLSDALANQYQAPVNETQEQLCQLWQNLLNIDKVGINDNFFDIGGHSLLATRLVSSIKQQFSAPISVRDIFEHSTVATMAQLVDQQTSADQTSTAQLPSIQATVRTGPLPLSFAQQRLWFIDSMQEQSAEYNMPIAFKVSGQLNLDVLQQVFNTIIERHEVLRTVYSDDDTGQGQQHVRAMEDITFAIAQYDLSHLSDDVQQAELTTQVEACIAEPFNLSRDLMLRAAYFKSSNDTGILVFNMHHIASDGWSMEVLAQEFFSLYQAYSEGQANPLPPLAIQYGDYAAWQNEHLGNEEHKSELLLSQLAHWEKQLDDVSPIHSLPLDFARPLHKQYQGKLLSASLPNTLAKQLASIAKQYQLTPFMLLHGALSLLISRYSNNHDVIVGTPVANRSQTELEPLIGFFVNTLVLRVDTDKPNLGEYFAHVRQTHLDAQSHQDVPFEQLVERLKVPRSTAYNPIFQIMLTTNTNFGINDEAPEDGLSLPGVELRGYDSDLVQEKFDLSIDMVLSEQGVDITWSYDTSLFTQTSIERMSNSFGTLLQAIADMNADNSANNKTKSICDISLISQSDKQQLNTWQQLTQAYPKDQNLGELFSQQALEHPNATAIIFNEQQLSYRQLDQQSNQLARKLIERGVTPGDIVGLCLPRSINTIVSLLGIVKAGGAYLPLDPNYPLSRLQMMMQDSGIKLLLRDDSLPSELSTELSNAMQNDGELINLSDESLLADVSTASIAINQDLPVAEQLLYVMYTSGSTGTPKGVKISHLNVVRLVKNTSFMPLNAQTVMLHASTVSFDAATLEIWGPLLNGGQLVLYPEQHLDLSRLNQVLVEKQVNSMWLTAGLFEQWSQSLPESNHLRWVLFGGDVCDPQAIKRVYQRHPSIQCINGYGPTENTTFTTTYAVPHDINFDRVKHFPLGNFIDGTSGKVMQADGSEAAIGMIGELYTSGDGVALGYQNLPELTAEKFVVDENGTRYYRTGDLVRYLPDGQLDFVGRIDSQVKIRGFRIEPEEVANLLATHNEVQSATVQVCGQGSDKFLAAYYVYQTISETISETESIETLNNQLMAWLKERLPPHMHPSVLIGLNEMPLTSNGKIDKKALPKPDLSNALANQYQAPVNETQEQLCQLWQNLLNIDKVGINDNFFDIGGHSLLATRLVSSVKQQFSAPVNVRDIFEHSTVAAMAELIGQLTNADQTSTEQLPSIEPLPRKDPITAPLPLSFAQQRLWFIYTMQGESAQYNMPIVFTVKGQLNLDVLKQVFSTMIERHEILRTVYSDNDKGQGQQHIRAMEDIAFAVAQYDLSHLSDDVQQAELTTQVEASIVEPFNLSHDLMLRVAYFKTSIDSGVLVFNMHHIASDGWSMEILAQELFSLYRAYITGQENPLPPLAIQYGDYAAWQNEHLGNEEHKSELLLSQLDYWQEQLDDVAPIHSLPLDFARPLHKQYQGKLVSTSLPHILAKQLASLAKQYQLTPFMLLHGALSLLISRYSNNHDVVIGTPVANRSQTELEPLIGFFVNTLVLRVDTNKQNLSEYFAHVRQTHLDAQSHQDVPFEQLVERIKAPRTTAYNPLVQIMLTTNTNFGINDVSDENGLSLPGVELQGYESDVVQEKFDLTIDINLSDQGVDITWSYDTSLFTQTSIERMSNSFATLLHAIVDISADNSANNKTKSIGDISLISQSDKQQLDTWQRLTQAYPKDQNLGELFSQQALEHPDATAIIFNEQQLSYRQLDQQSNQLARKLIERGVTAGDIVGLCLPRNINTIIALLGIIKAGGAYLPLDPNYPLSRLQMMMQDSGIKLLLRDDSLPSELSTELSNAMQNDGELINLSDESLLADVSTASIAINQDLPVAEQLLYVMYTSGSTGTPKGVMVSHLNVVRLVKNTSFMPLNAQTVMLHASTVSFDAATLEIWGPLLNGGQLVLYPEQHLDLSRLNQVLVEKQVNSMWLTAGLFEQWSQLLPEDNELPDNNHLRWVLFGGDVCDPQAIKRVYQRHPSIQCINGYGPTENTTFTTTYAVPHDINFDRVKHFPLGNFIDGSSGKVMQADGSEAAIGMIGELYTSGDGVALGYQNLPELTAEKFVVDENGIRYYRTGDLVRYLPDGQLDFVGRIDSQVKIRGFRIEPEEVANLLATHKEVQSATVQVCGQGSDKFLAAYYVHQTISETESDEILNNQLMAWLKERLPPHMHPSVLIGLEQMPLTSNGKIDKKALPQPDLSNALANQYQAPVNETQEQLCQLWQNLLNIDKVGINDNFFDIGGHSLLATRMVSAVKQQLSAPINVRDVFEHSTIASLADIIDNQARIEHINIVPVSKQAPLPLSFAQQRLWFIDSIQGQSTEYNMPVIFEVSGQLNLAVLNQAFNTIIERHEVLRTIYVSDENGQGQQLVRPVEDAQFTIEKHDLSDLTGHRQTSELRVLVEESLNKPFDLSNDLMLRGAYVKKSSDTGILVFNMHHIASDGWSMEILAQEFFSLYKAYIAGQPNPLPPLAIQYGDYAHWQSEHLGNTERKSELLLSQLEYWEKQLDQVSPLHSLQLDFPRPSEKQFVGKHVTSSLPAETAKQLLSVAKQYRLTPFMLLHGALALLLSRHSNNHDIVIGTPVANRPVTELETLIGFFVNTLVLRVDTNKQTLSEYFDHIRHTHLDAQSHQDVPFEQLVERLKTPRSKAHTPLFQIMLTTGTNFGIDDTSSEDAISLPNVELRGHESDFIQEKFDLSIDLNISEQGVGLTWSYDIALFSEAHIEQLNQHLCRLFEGIAQNRATTLNDLPMLSSGEIEQLVFELNDVHVDYPKDLCMHQLFEIQAQKTPDNIAVLFEQQHITYQQLNHKANQLAHYLRANFDIKPDTFIGVSVARSIEMVIGIMAVLKTGAGYVPLDPTYPKERLKYIAQDAAVSVVLTHNRVADAMSEYKGTLLALDGLANSDEHVCASFSTNNLEPSDTKVSPENLAYTIYTSGSTGVPKGVLIEHRNAVAMLGWSKTEYPLDSLEVMLASTSLNFDISVYELFLPLSIGTRVRVVENVMELASSEHISDITLINTVPSAMDALVKLKIIPKRVKIINLAGEALKPSNVNDILELRPDITVYNLYGPSEDTTYSTFSRFDKLQTETPHIGRVIANSIGLILDEQQQLVPYGVPGELYLAGDGISRGYLNLPDLTAERYIDNPYYHEKQAASAKRMYRTGDIVRYLPDGNLVCLGRIDHQVKIRGFRIELTDIEHNINALADVDSALVMASEIAGSKQLVSYVLPKDAAHYEQQGNFIASIQQHLTQALPQYMVPSIFIVMEQWPMTPNGKIDRKALPAPDEMALQGEYVAPSNEIEKQLVTIWSQLLDIDADSISSTASFFALGGHSLLSLRLLASIHNKISKAIDLGSLFEATTIQAQAQLITQMQNSSDTVELLRQVKDSDSPTKGIFLIPGIASSDRDFKDIIATLGQSTESCVEVGIFRHQGLVEGQDYFDSIEDNAIAFADAIKQRSYKTVTLVGHSYGGALAMATVNQLIEAGYQVNLVMLDTYFGQSKIEQVFPEDVPTHMQQLFDHQSRLFCDYVPKLNQKVPTTLVLATQKPNFIDTDQYKDYLNNHLSGLNIHYDPIEGDHYSILYGQNAINIATIITREGND